MSLDTDDVLALERADRRALRGISTHARRSMDVLHRRHHRPAGAGRAMFDLERLAPALARFCAKTPPPSSTASLACSSVFQRDGAEDDQTLLVVGSTEKNLLFSAFVTRSWRENVAGSFRRGVSEGRAGVCCMRKRGRPCPHLVALRVAAGLAFAEHGAQKLPVFSAGRRGAELATRLAASSNS